MKATYTKNYARCLQKPKDLSAAFRDRQFHHVLDTKIRNICHFQIQLSHLGAMRFMCLGKELNGPD